MALTLASNAITFTDNTSLSSGIITATQLSAGAVQQSFGNTSGAYNFRNKLINGNFDIWQRGTTFTNSANSHQYAADRWWVFGGINTVASCNRVTLTNTDLANFYFASRVQRVAGNTGTAAVAYGQVFETAHSIPLAGKTVTLSFYARRGPNFSAASNLLQAAVFTGTGTDQSVPNLLLQAWTGYSNSLVQVVPITTTFARYTVTFTLPSNITQAAIVFLYSGTGAAGAGDYFDITGIQLEEGAVATPFEQRPTALEYSMCLRYYELGYAFLDNNTSPSIGDIQWRLIYSFKQPKRTLTPVVTRTSGPPAATTPGGFAPPALLNDLRCVVSCNIPATPQEYEIGFTIDAEF